MENIVGEVIQGASIPRDRLHSLTRDRQGAYGRNLVAYLARKVAGYGVKEITQHFKREPMTISLFHTISTDYYLGIDDKESLA